MISNNYNYIPSPLEATSVANKIGALFSRNSATKQNNHCHNPLKGKIVFELPVVVLVPYRKSSAESMGTGPVFNEIRTISRTLICFFWQQHQ